jgi:hypothetical protein
LNIYLRSIDGESSSKKLLLLSELAKKTPYSEKYLNLLARYGKIEAEKDGRNWVSSLEAIKDYQKNRQRKRK